MTYIEIIDEKSAEGKLANIYAAAIERTGGVANIIKMMSQDAHSCQASMQFYTSMMKSPNALDAATREMLATVVSNVNDCHY